MTGATISRVTAWEALDSRGRPTVGCVVSLANGAHGRALAPSGASTGSHEARELRDGDERYDGFGVRRAVANVEAVLRDAVMGLDARDTAAVDAALERMDADPLLGGVGANAVLAISLAAALAGADAARMPLWRLLGGNRPRLPMPMVNIISGGAHAGRALDVQDILAVPVGATTFTQALEWVSRVRAGTAEVLRERGHATALVADEGGLAAALPDNEAALAAVVDGIHRAGLAPGADVSLAVDIAANQLWDGEAYHLELEGERLDERAWLRRLLSWCDAYPVVSLEDVLAEDEWHGWAAATSLLGTDCQIVGDDLFATNAARLERGFQTSVANAVLVKPNQAGTFSRARRVLELAQRQGYATVVSARSGDTEDHWLSDLAVGLDAGQIKVGSTMRSERTTKWNRLLEIEASAGGAACLAPWPWADDHPLR
ncbi:phosphopyruvate hydratase [Terrabacter terrigena]|uniref:Enolase n=1 Tax=Terrabacter terrigena TaxID=574718 RepID=A0ABW3MU70_9MICO